MDVPLQPLRIPSGWTVVFNDGLYEIDPVAERIPEDKRILFFREDLLLLTNSYHKRSLDVGWYPEADLENGEYGLVLFEADDYERRLYELRTRDRLELVAAIERILLGVIDGTL